MDGNWILLGLATWVLCLLFALTLMRAAGKQPPRPTPQATARRAPFRRPDYARQYVNGGRRAAVIGGSLRHPAHGRDAGPGM